MKILGVSDVVQMQRARVQKFRFGGFLAPKIRGVSNIKFNIWWFSCTLKFEGFLAFLQLFVGLSVWQYKIFECAKKIVRYDRVNRADATSLARGDYLAVPVPRY